MKREDQMAGIVLELKSVIGENVAFNSDDGFKIVQEAVNNGRGVYLWTVGWSQYTIRKVDPNAMIVTAENSKNESVELPFESIRGVSEAFKNDFANDVALSIVRHYGISVDKACEIAESFMPEIQKAIGAKNGK